MRPRPWARLGYLAALLLCAQQFQAAPGGWRFAPKSHPQEKKPPVSAKTKQPKSLSVATRQQIAQSVSKLPLQFEPLTAPGQSAPAGSYLARGKGYALAIEPAELRLALLRQVEKNQPEANESRNDAKRTPRIQISRLSLRLAGANPQSKPAAQQELPGRVNYFLGKDPRKWRTGVRTYGKVVYEQIYPGVDLVFYGNQQEVEYDFVVAPGADPRRIALDVLGASGVKLEASGDAAMTVPGGMVRLKKPILYQEIDGKRKPVSGGFALKGRRLSFQTGAYDRTKPLVIDPVLSFSTFFGGSNDDNKTFGNENGAVVVDGAGDIYIAGTTVSPDLPFTAGVVDTTCGTDGTCDGGFADVFVAKLNAGGNTLLYSTFLGGENEDTLGTVGNGGLDVDSTGNAYVVGATRSISFPTTAGALDTTCGTDGFCNGGFFDAFVTKLDPNGANLVYSTYLGGSQSDEAADVRVNAAGSAFVVGITGSSNFPATGGAYQTTLGGTIDAFVALLNATGSSLAYATYLGGSSFDAAVSLDIDSSDIAYLTGYTNSLNFPTTGGALQTAAAGTVMNKTTNAAGAWAASASGITDGQIRAVVVAPSNSQTLFAGSPLTVFKSTNGGATWTAQAGFPTVDVRSLAVDPLSDQIVYAGTAQGVYKTTDGGANWTFSSSGLGGIQVNALVIDPGNPQIVYAATDGGGVFKSTDGAANWVSSNTGIFAGVIHTLVIDPSAPTTLYAGADNGVYKTTNGASNWTSASTGIDFNRVLVLAIDPTSPSNLYAGIDDPGIEHRGGLYKSTNGGGNWVLSNTGLAQEEIAAIVVDPVTSSTVYAGTHNSGVFKSTDSGGNWVAANTGMARNVNALALDPTAPATLYAATDVSEAFVTALNSTGSALVFSTYLGGSGADAGHGIFFESVTQDLFVTGATGSPDFVTTAGAFQQVFGGVEDAFVVRINNTGTTRVYATFLGGSGIDVAIDIAAKSNGEVWVVGGTVSPDFPLANTFRGALMGVNQPDAFIAKLNNTGSTLMFSTYWGGSSEDVALGVALDGTGNPVVTGFTRSDDFFAINAFQPQIAGGTDAFLLKISDVAVFADLSVTGGHTPEPVPFGSPVTFFFTVTNNGPSTANNVVVYGSSSTEAVDVIATGATPSQGTCSIVPNIVCNFGTLASGASASVTITAFASNSGVFAGTLGVGADESDPNPADNTATRVVTFLPGSDLGIQQFITPNSILSGTNVNIVLQVGHVSGDPLTGVMVNNPLPTGLTFVSVTSTQGTCGFTAPNVNCNIGNLGIDQSETIAITVTASGSGSIQNTATATADQTDPFTANNSATATLTVLGAGAAERYVLAERENAEVSVRNVSDDALVRVAFAGTSPNSLVVSPNGRLAFVANLNSNYVSVLDLTIGEEIKRIRGVRARQLAFTPDGSQIVAIGVPEEVYVMDPVTLTLVQTISLDGQVGDTFGVRDVGLASMAVTPGKVWINTQTTHGVVLVDLSSQSVTVIGGTTGGSSRFASTIGATPDGLFVIAGRNSPPQIYIIDAENEFVLQTNSVAAAINALAVTRQIGDPDGQHAFVVTGSNLAVVDLDPGSGTFGQVLGSPAALPFFVNPAQLALTADSNRLYYAVDSLTLTNNFAIIDTNQILTSPGTMVLSQTRIGQRLRAATVALVDTTIPSGAPTITGFSPNTLFNDVTNTLTLDGTNFQSDTEVRIGMEDPLAVTFLSATQVEVTIPPGFTSIDAPRIVATNPNIGSTPDGQHLSGATPAPGFAIRSPLNYQPLHQVATADFGGRSTSVLNANTRTFGQFNLSRTPITLTSEPNGQRMYLDGFAPSQQIMPFNLGTLTEETAIPRSDPNTLAQGNTLVSRLHPTSGNAVVYAINSVGTFPNALDDQLNIIDAHPGSPTLNQVIDTISSGIFDAAGFPNGIAATPDGRYVYTLSVNDISGDSLIIYDVVAHTAVSFPSAGLGISQFQPSMQVSSNGTLLFLSTNVGSIKVYDIATNPFSPIEVEEIFGIGSSLEAFRVVPNGGALDEVVAWAPDLGEIQVFEINYVLGQLNFLNAFPVPGAVGQSAQGFGISPNNQYLYLPLPDYDAVAVLDLNAIFTISGNAFVTRLAAGIGPNDTAVNATMVPNTDLSLTLTDSTDPVPINTNFAYFVVVTNNGAIAANNVTLTVTLPSNVSLGPIFPDQGTCTPGATVVCNLGTIGPSGVVNVGINLSATSFVTLSASAVVSADEPDPNFANNTATETTAVTSASCTINFTDGGGTLNWNLAANWDLNRLPGAGDDVCIPSGFTSVKLSTGTFSVNSLSASSPLDVTGGSLTLVAGSVINDVMNFSGGTITGTGDITLNEFTVWTGGTWSGSGTIFIRPAGGHLNISGSGSIVLTERTIDVGAGADLSWDSTVNVQHGVGAIINVQSTANFLIETDQTLLHNQGGTPLTINNLGFLKKTTGVGTAIVDAVVNNSGNVEVLSGTLRFIRGGASPGSFSVSPSAFLEFAGGTHDLSGATFSSSGGTVLFSSGTLTTSTLTNVNNQFDFTGGTLSGAGTFKFTSPLNWSGGTMAGGGITEIVFPNVLNINPAVGVTIQNRTIELAGAAFWTGVGVINHGIGGVINIQSGGSFNVQNDSTFLHNQGGVRLTINNSGVFSKDLGTGTTIVEATFNNQTSGTTVVNSGTLDLRNGGTSPGFFQTSSGAVLLFTGGTHDVTNAVFINTGTVRLNLATLTSSGPVDFFSPFEMVAGTLTGTGTFTFNGNWLWTSGLQSGSGTSVVPFGTTLTINGPVSLQARTINNFGTINYVGGTINHGIGATLNNQSGALFDIQGDFSFVFNQGGARTIFNNTGMLKKSAGGATSTLDVTLNNVATLEVQIGTASLTGGGTSSGTFTANAGATLQFAGGTHDISGAVFASAGGLVSLTAGTLTSSTTTDFNDNFTHSGGTLTGTGIYNFDFPVNWTGGTWSGSGSSVIAAGNTLTINGSVTLQARTISIFGTINFAAGTINHGIGAVINNQSGGVFDIQNDLNFVFNQGGARTTFNNAGTLKKSAGGGTATFDADLANTNLVEIFAGTLNFTGGGSSSAMFVPNTSTLLRFGGGTFDLTGSTITASGGLTQLSTGSLTSTGPVTMNSPFDFTGGSITGTGSFTFTTTLTWSGGTMSGSGSTVISTGANLDISGAGGKTWTARTLDNFGTVRVTGTGSVNHGVGAIFNNQIGGTFDIQTDMIFAFNQGGARLSLNNDSTMMKSAGAGPTSLDINLAGSGDVSALSGFLQFTGGAGTNTGNFTVATGSTLAFSGTFTLDPAAGNSISGPGSIRFNGGTTTIGGAGSGTFSPDITEIIGGTANFVTTSASTITLNFTSGSLGGSGILIVNNSATWSGGTLANSGGTLQIVSGATLDIAGAGGKTWHGYTLLNNGTVNITGTGNINHGLGAVLNNQAGATFDIQADMTFAFNQGGARLTVNNLGSLTKSAGAGMATLDVVLNNDNLISVTSGTLRFTGGGGTSTGDFSVTSGNTLDFNGGAQGVTLASGRNFSGAGTMQFSGGTTVIGGSGSYAITGLTQINGGTANFNLPSSTTTQLSFSSGNLGGTGTLSVNSSGIWSGGTLANTGGQLEIGTGATLDISGTGSKTWLGYTLRNNGTVIITGTGTINHGLGAVLTNNAGATFDIQVDLTFGFNQGGARLTINNQGTLLKSAGAGTSTLDVTLNNDGDVNANSGTLRFTGGGGTSTANFSVTSGNTLDFNGGTHTITLGATESISGAGTLGFSGGTTNIGGAGSFSITGLVQINGGTANFNLPSSTTTQFSFSSGNLGGTGTLTVNASGIWSGGTLASGGGILEIAIGATLDISGAVGKTWHGHTLTNNGTVVITGTGTINHGLGGVISNSAGATFDIQADLTLAFNQGGARLTISNLGTLVKSAGAGTATLDVTLNNGASVSVTSGTLRFTGGGGSSIGDFSVTAGNALDFNGGTQTINLNSNRSISGAGTLGFSGGTTNIGGAGTFAITGLVLINGGTANFDLASSTTSQLDFSSGNLGGSGLLTVTTSATWSGGTLANTGGTLEIASGANLNISGTASKTWHGYTLSNNGTVNITGTGTVNHGLGSVINNQAGATFDNQVDMTFAFNQGGARLTINNFGLLRKSGGTGTTAFDVTFNNSGAVVAGSGVMSFPTSYTQSAGTTTLDSASMSVSTMTLNGGTLLGIGTITGNVANNATVGPGFSAGIINITGSYTQSSSGVLNIEISGLTAGTQYDQLNISGTATLNGTLNITYFGGFLPVVGDSFTPITYASSSGGFTTTNGLVQSGVTLQATQGATSFVLTTSAVGGTDADLTLTKSVSHDPATIGNNITYTLTVSNAGPAAASNVVLTDTLPAGVTFVSAIASQGSCSGTTTVTCNLGTINAPASATVTIVATVNSTGTLANSASVTATETDPNPADNSATLNSQAVAAVCTTVPSGLISWWRAEFTAKDSFAANSGTLINGAAFGTGMVRQAFSFDGIDDSVNFTPTTTPSLGAQATIEFWMKPDPSNPMNTCCQGLVDLGGGFKIEISPGIGAITGVNVVGNTGAGAVHTSDLTNGGFPVAPGQWHHVVGTYDGTALKLYVDGILRSQTPLSGTLVPVPAGNFMTFGSEDGALHCPGCVGQRYFFGLIDEVKIFNRALSASEVAANFAAGTAGHCQFDGEIDFSVAANPNGVWSYGSLPSPGAFSLFTTANPGSPIEGWQGSGSGPFFSHNVTQSNFTSGTVSIPARTLAYDPSFSGVTTTLRWTAPAAGSYRVSAVWEGRDTGGTTVNVFVLKNNSQLFTQFLSGFTAKQSFLSNLTLQAGDFVDFVIDSAGGVTNDTTAIEAIVTPLAPISPPVLQSVTPNTGSPLGGTPVTLTGQDFQVGATVTFGGVPATSVVVVSPTQITAVTPAGSGLVSVTVTNPDTQFSTLVNAFTFQGQADLAPSVVDVVDPVNVGSNITYDLNVFNNGPDDATNVILHLALDPTTSFVSASAGCSHAAGVVSCTVGTVPSDVTSTTFQVVVTTTAASAPAVNASLNATMNEVDPNSSNDTDAEQTTVIPQADLALTKIASPSPAITQNNNLTYTLTVTNNGPSPATGVVLTDLLPAGVNFVSSTPSQGTCAGTATVTCNLGTIASGASVTVTIVVQPPTPGSINNTASVAANESDPNTANNAASAATTVNPATADLTLTKTDSPDPVPANGSLTYTLLVFNNGPDPATSVVLTDTLPAGVALASASPNQGSCTGTATITCNLGTINANASATVTIVVTPSAPGTLNNTASVTANEVEPNPTDNTASAVTTVIIGPVIGLSTTILNFPSQPVGSTSSPQSVTVSNTGSSALNISSVVVTGDFAQTNTCGASLAAGASCAFFITFTPTTTGTLSGSLSITHDAAGSPSVVTFTGDGINAAAISLSTTSLVFGSRPIGSTSAPQSITLTNSGNATLNITSIVATGDFAQTNNCGATVAAGAFCVIDVTFTPTASGQRTGGITITSDARGSVPTITLTGFGVAQGVTLSTSIVVFGTQLVGTTSAAQNVTLTNNGASALTINSIVVAGDFAQTNNCGSSVAAGASCVIQVTFTPSAVGVSSGSLTITDSGAGSPRTISLSGTGVTATITLSTNNLTFAGQTVATTSPPQSITLTNTGSTALTINSIIVSADFGQTNNCGSTVNAGAFCVIQVTFTPSSSGLITGTLTINSSAAGSPHIITLTGTGITTGPAVGLSANSLTFAAQIVGTTSAVQSVTLTNTGNATLTINTISASGDFGQTNNCPLAPATLAAGASCVINVTFTPTTIGVRAGAVTITDDAPSSPQLINLSGQGLPAGPAVNLSPISLAFSGQVVSTTSTAQNISLANVGNATLNIANIQTSGDFAQTNNCGASLAAGTACTISVTFTPTASGPRSGALTITHNAAGSPHTVPLSGTGSSFALSMPPGAPVSATVSPGQSASFTIVLTPSGGFTGTVQLTCNGLPAGTTCVFSQNNFLLTGPTTITVTIVTTAPSSGTALPAPPSLPPLDPRVLYVFALGMALAMMLLSLRICRGMALRQRRSVVAVALVLCIAVMGAACASGTGAPAAIGRTAGTPSGTFPITVTATSSGGFSASTSVTVTVR
jgi:uncharacterized repeat protein (TIGR01451 family)